MGLILNVVITVLVFSLAFYAGCTPGSSNPVRAACEEKAAQIAPELAKLAAQRGMTAGTQTTEFVGVCEGQLQQDLDQTLPAILAIVDAGADQ